MKFEIKSAHPADNNLKGEFAIILLSAITAIGAWALADVEVLGFFIEAKGDTIPSCEAVVGIETKNTFLSYEANLATSMTFPPPTPKTLVPGVIISLTSSTESYDTFSTILTSTSIS